MTHANIKPAAMTVPRTADYLDMGESTIWKLIRNKKLRAIRIGRSTRVAVADADALLEASRAA